MPANPLKLPKHLFISKTIAAGTTLKRVRLQPRTTIESIMSNGSRLSIIAMGLIAGVFALKQAEMILAPILLGIILGMMMTPIARAMERRGVPSALSGAVVLVFFILGVIGLTASLALPLSTWAGQIPAMWENLRAQLLDFRGLFGTIGSLKQQLGSMMGEVGGVLVRVDDSSALQSAAWMGPTLAAEAMLLLASLYFFIVTRDRIRIAILSIRMTRRLRWRLAHVFRDIETLVSKYLLIITAINAGLGISVSLALWWAGVPSPIMWGVLAAVFNYVTYLGPAIMVVLLLSVGLATSDGAGVLAPALIYLVLNILESQFVTTHVLGRTMTLNPFVVFLSLVFWIWLWGPIGGFIAVPWLLIMYALIRNVMPIAETSKKDQTT